MTPEEQGMQIEIAELLDWKGPFERSGQTDLLYGIDPQDDQRRPIADWPTDLGDALALCQCILKAHSILTLIIYHQNDEGYVGPVAILEQERLDKPDFFGYLPDIMCDRHDSDRLAFSLCVAMRDALQAGFKP